MYHYFLSFPKQHNEMYRSYHGNWQNKIVQYFGIFPTDLNMNEYKLDRHFLSFPWQVNKNNSDYYGNWWNTNIQKACGISSLFFCDWIRYIDVTTEANGTVLYQTFLSVLNENSELPYKRHMGFPPFFLYNWIQMIQVIMETNRTECTTLFPLFSTKHNTSMHGNTMGLWVFI